MWVREKTLLDYCNLLQSKFRAIYIISFLQKQQQKECKRTSSKLISSSRVQRKILEEEGTGSSAAVRKVPEETSQSRGGKSLATLNCLLSTLLRTNLCFIQNFFSQIVFQQSFQFYGH